MSFTMLKKQRSLFEMPSEISYLNCSYMGPLLHTVRAAGEQGLRRRSKPWEITPIDFFNRAEEVRRLFAKVIHADTDGIALVPSASYGLAVAAANVPFKAGQKIVLLDKQFPSNVLVWKELAKAKGGKTVTLTRPANEDWTATVVNAIDAATGVVAVPNFHWCDGTRVDLVPVRKRCDEVGAALVVDASQSVGAVVTDVNSFKPDFLVSVGYKWLLGPYGLSLLYVAPKFREGKPIEFNWINRADSEKFSALSAAEHFQPGARRFDVGEKSNTILLPMMEAAIRQILSWGIENIQATAREHTAKIEDLTRELGLSPTPQKLRADHIVGVGLPKGDPLAVVQKLARSSVFVSARGDSIRVSPHVYNDETDVERFITALKSA